MIAPTRTISQSEALRLVVAYSYQPKNTYVRVNERKSLERYQINGKPKYVLVLHTNVYSKTWSKNTARIWSYADNDTTPTELTTRQAKKLLGH